MIQPHHRHRQVAAATIAVLLMLLSGASGGHAAEASGSQTNWWSLAPLNKPAVPDIQRPGWTVRNPVDAFIHERLAVEGLRPSPQAEARTLIRRLYFDLAGLPPEPDEVEAFASAPTDEAYEAIVDRLLASPRHGERWARHWLDVVHYGETHGYDKDKPRPNAWPYRDYVIRSLNEDKPYGRFIQEQLAGDVLFPSTRDGIEALGFIAAGPWDFIGHEEVPETKTDGKVARHLDRDDMVANTLQTFNSLTVQCAACHNHKFDPIPQEDYYRLQAVFAAVDRTHRKYDTNPAVAAKREELERARTEAEARKASVESNVTARAAAPLAELDGQIKAAEKSGKSPDAVGYHSAIEPKDAVEKWVQVDLGTSRRLDRLVLRPCKDDFNGIGEGFGYPRRFRVEVSTDPAFGPGKREVVSKTAADVPGPGLAAQEFRFEPGEARFIRITATRLAPRQNDFIFALAELEAYDGASTNLAAGAAVSALDSIEAPPRWRKHNLTDGEYERSKSAGGIDIAVLRKRRAEVWQAAAGADEVQTLAQADQEIAASKAGMEKLPAQSQVYIAAVHRGGGAFRGTGADGGRPRPIHVLNRGSVLKPEKEVSAGALRALTALQADFNLSAHAPEGERRAALARWLSDPANPLTWRSAVNRVWQYHFGRGLVETPNDFGRMGALPSHPALLDWLAVEFRDGGQSLKRLHKLLVMSATYRQSSRAAEGDPALSRDQDNRMLSRMPRRKLEAEALRDTVLWAAGKLDLTMGGPSFQDFVIEKPEHSPHYQYHLHDPEDPKSHRRSVYRFLVRSQQQPFMASLDCADPSMQVGRRNESVSPLQALSVLNNALMLSMSGHFAQRVQSTGGSLDQQVSRAFLLAVARPPLESELRPLVDYASRHGMTNLCRVLYNLNEFAFID